MFLKNFLLLEEKEEASSENRKIIPVVTGEMPGVRLDKVSCNWSKEKQALTDVSFEAKGSKLSAVVGAVGSGKVNGVNVLISNKRSFTLLSLKSSLLEALLGELPIREGKLVINGSLSFASQEPWIFAGTVRENILFGNEYIPKRYMDTLEVCSLLLDIKRMCDGDFTTIGEKGSTLSGGQKVRTDTCKKQPRLRCIANIYSSHRPESAWRGPSTKRPTFTSLMIHYLQLMLTLGGICLRNASRDSSRTKMSSWSLTSFIL